MTRAKMKIMHEIVSIEAEMGAKDTIWKLPKNRKTEIVSIDVQIGENHTKSGNYIIFPQQPQTQKQPQSFSNTSYCINGNPVLDTGFNLYFIFTFLQFQKQYVLVLLVILYAIHQLHGE